jgi:hypothetical protein
MKIERAKIDYGFSIYTQPFLNPQRSRIHECTISLRFLDTILRVLRLEVSVYNVYITHQTTTFARGGRGGGGGGKSVSRGDCE